MSQTVIERTSQINKVIYIPQPILRRSAGSFLPRDRLKVGCQFRIVLKVFVPADFSKRAVQNERVK